MRISAFHSNILRNKPLQSMHATECIQSRLLKKCQEQESAKAGPNYIERPTIVLIRVHYLALQMGI